MIPGDGNSLMQNQMLNQNFGAGFNLAQQPQEPNQQMINMAAGLPPAFGMGQQMPGQVNSVIS